MSIVDEKLDVASVVVVVVVNLILVVLSLLLVVLSLLLLVVSVSVVTVDVDADVFCDYRYINSINLSYIS